MVIAETGAIIDCLVTKADGRFRAPGGCPVRKPLSLLSALCRGFADALAVGHAGHPPAWTVWTAGPANGPRMVDQHLDFLESGTRVARMVRRG